MKIRTAFTSITSAILLSTSMAASAHNYDDDCNIELNGNLKYENEIITVTFDNGDQAEFTSSGDVYYEGQLLSLSASETRLAQQYYASIHEAVPTTIEVAREAVDIASTAVTEVFSELLGGDDDLTHEFGEFFDEVNIELDNKFYTQDGSFYMDTTSFEEGEWFDQSWENEFEQKVEALVAKSIGRLLVAVGTEMMFGDGDTSDFEARMENFGEDLEQRLTARSEVLEVKAERLCTLLTEADSAENALSTSVAELSNLEIFNVESHRQSM